MRSPAAVEPLLRVTAHPSISYGPRTVHNATASEATVSFSASFDTAGERLTRTAAGARKFLALPLDQDPIHSARALYRHLRALDARVLNVAGNSLATLARLNTPWTQATLDEHVGQVLATVHRHWPLARIMTGGQTGADLSGAVAGVALGVPVEVIMPAGFLQRGADGRDRANTEASVRSTILAAASRLRARAFVPG